MNQKPSVGRIVHFIAQTPEGQKLAALITEVFSDTCVALAVFPPGGTPLSRSSVILGTGAGQWCWPERI